MISSCIFALVLFFSGLTSAEAQTPTTRPHVKVNSANNLHIGYTFAAWNKSPSRIDTAIILLREGATGRLVQIDLTETAPDSGVFSGMYSIAWQNIESLQVEFYVPPQDLMHSKNSLKTLASMIASKELKRKPFLLRRVKTGDQMIEIFDTREEAQAAYKSYRANQDALMVKNKKATGVLSNQELETAELAQDLRMQQMAAANAAERQRLNQAEVTRWRASLSAFQVLPLAEKNKRRHEAEKIAANGMDLFRQEKFSDALERFRRALELNPENPTYFFQQGVCYYKLEQFNKSLVFLSLAEGKDVRPVEKSYFMGLDFFRLKEYNAAVKNLDSVVAMKDPALSPAAKFYKGIVYFEAKRWDDAQKAFQMVLDESPDPKLDETAEAYINQILHIRQFEAEKAKKWSITATMGEQYDSNVLLSSDSSLDTGTATNNSGWRSLLLGSFKFRPVYEETHEFAAQLDTVTMYTLDQGLSYSANLRNDDPTVVTLTLPYTHKGMLFGKGHKLDITPGYEDIFMSIEDGTQKVIIQSYTLGISNLLVMSETWFANYNLDLRQDNSKLNSSTGDADSTAFKLKLTDSNIFMVSEDKTKIVTAAAALTLNQANGIDYTYDRLDLSVGYIQPTFWEMSGNVGLAYFYQDYPQILGGRTDNSYTVSGGLSKKLNDIWSTGFLANYNINNSSLDADQYKKWTALLTMSAAYSF